MLNIAVCDDDGFEAVLIATYIKEYQKKHTEFDINYKLFHSSIELLECVDNGIDFDIYLLDIIMPEITGLTIGKRLRELSKRGVIIYLSSSKDYALDAYQVYALQYLVKPIDYNTFCSTIDMAVENIEPAHSSSLTVKTLEGTQKIHFASISYIQCDKHTLFFYLSDGRIIRSRNIRVSFDEAVSELLADSRFIRIHQSFVVNMSYVNKLENQTFELDFNNSKVILQIAKNRVPCVKKQYCNFKH